MKYLFFNKKKNVQKLIKCDFLKSFIFYLSLSRGTYPENYRPFLFCKVAKLRKSTENEILIPPPTIYVFLYKYIFLYKVLEEMESVTRILVAFHFAQMKV